MPTHSRGFTLVEVLVATLVLGSVALIVHQSLSQMQNAAKSIERQARQHDVRINGLRELKDLFDNMLQPSSPSPADDSIGPALSTGLTANSHEMRFATLCRNSVAGKKTCRVQLSASVANNNEARDGNHFDSEWRLVALLPQNENVVLARSREPIRLLYLATANDGGGWSNHWMPLVPLPLAVGLLIDGDTTLLRVGGGWR